MHPKICIELDQQNHLNGYDVRISEQPLVAESVKRGEVCSHIQFLEFTEWNGVTYDHARGDRHP